MKFFKIMFYRLFYNVNIYGLKDVLIFKIVIVKVNGYKDVFKKRKRY